MKQHRMLLPLVLCLGTVILPVSAQCGSVGNARLESDPQAIGTTVSIVISGGANAAFGLYLSDGPGPLNVPGLGNVCLTTTSSAFALLLQGVLAANGSFSIPFVVPNDPNLLAALGFLQGVVADPAMPLGLALSNGLRTDFAQPDSFETLATGLLAPRTLAAGAEAGNGRILIAGGGSGSVFAPVGTNTSELFDPVLRQVFPGPPMQNSRAFHTATALLDGRVLVVGGVVGATGTVDSSCEVYNPSTDTFQPVASMGSLRAGHTATLLADGRVLVTGGTSTFTAATLGPILNAAQDSGEVYNPTTNTWTAVSNVMSSKRFGGAAVRLPNGNVLVTTGLSGASNFFGQELPTFSSTTSVYNPTTNQFSAGASFGSSSARAFHSASLMPDGRVFAAGGLVGGLIPAVTNTTRLLNAAGTTWSAGPALPVAIALPAPILLRNGKVHIAGGVGGNVLTQTFAAVTNCVRYDGATLANKTSLASAQGNHVAVRLADGSVLLAGGIDATGAAISTVRIYTADP